MEFVNSRIKLVLLWSIHLKMVNISLAHCYEHNCPKQNLKKYISKIVSYSVFPWFVPLLKAIPARAIPPANKFTSVFVNNFVKRSQIKKPI